MQPRPIIPSCRREAQRHRRRHLAQLAGMVLLATAGFCTGLSAWLDHRAATRRMPLAEALWVSDRDLTRLYAPGTPEQQGVVARFLATRGNGSAASQRFQAPLLYRRGMGVGSADPGEGIVIVPFPRRAPETE